jgi:pyrroline-5-carboxylate reductase
MGCGNMGGAILQAWLDQGWDAAKVTIVDPKPSALPAKLSAYAAITPDMPSPDLVLLAVKPQMLDAIVPSLAPRVQKETLLVSILAGVECDQLRARFPDAGGIVRLMPNLAVRVGKSPMILFADAADDVQSAADALFSPLGPTEWLAAEDQMHLSTALAGSGPAFVYRFIDALAGAASDLGMDPDQAARLAMVMVDGAATLAAQSDVSPAELANRVASPGGVTREGLNVMDDDNAIRSLMTRVLDAAQRRNRAMAVEAGGAEAG